MKILRRIIKSTLLILAVCFLALAPAGYADAAVDNVITKAKKTQAPSGTWKETQQGRRYLCSDGSYAKNRWLYLDGTVYYFSGQGYVNTGWFKYRKQTYYADAKGKVYVSQWLKTKKETYYLKKNGVRAEKEWVKKGGKYYYFNQDGTMASSCQIVHGGKYYYVNQSGARITNSWLVQDGKKYFFGKNGVRYQNKWVKSKGKYYYLKKNGVMAKSAWVGNYYVGSDGARKTNCKVNGYYLDATGKRAKPVKFSGKYLMVGDSRTVGMGMSVSTSKTKFIGKVSMGYTWMCSSAIPQVRQYLAGNPKLKVVFAFGINDLGNASRYISSYKALMKEFPKTEFYFLSVNPVKEAEAIACGYEVHNADIKNFNSRLKSAFGSRYLNTYSYLTKNGYSAMDGVHYTSNTYQKLYQYIIRKIG